MYHFVTQCEDLSVKRDFHKQNLHLGTCWENSYVDFPILWRFYDYIVVNVTKGRMIKVLETISTSWINQKSIYKRWILNFTLLWTLENMPFGLQNFDDTPLTDVHDDMIRWIPSNNMIGHQAHHFRRSNYILGITKKCFPKLNVSYFFFEFETEPLVFIVYEKSVISILAFQSLLFVLFSARQTILRSHHKIFSIWMTLREFWFFFHEYLIFFSYSAISFIKTKNDVPDIQQKDKQNGSTYSVCIIV